MGQLSITLVRADTNQEFDVELPDDAPVKELVPALVKELGLPLTGPDGNQVAYEIANKRSGRGYSETDTLASAGTKAGDNLLLTSTFVAGGIGGESPLDFDHNKGLWAELVQGRRVRVDERLFNYYLDVLPPYFMGKLVTLMDGTQKYASFGFVEGADRVVAFWRENGRYYAQQTTIVSEGI